MTFNDYNATMIWFGEGLATNLSNQFKKMEINCSLDDIIYGEGIAHSKKEAEQQAACDALKKAQKC